MDILVEIMKNDDQFNVEKHVNELCNDIVDMFNTNQSLKLKQLTSKVRILYSFVELLQDEHFKAKIESLFVTDKLRSVFDFLLDVYFEHTDTDLTSASANVLLSVMKPTILTSSNQQICENALIKKFSLFVKQGHSDSTEYFDVDNHLYQKLYHLIDCCADFSDCLIGNLLRMLSDQICSSNAYSEHYHHCVMLFEGILMTVKLNEVVENVISECLDMMDTFLNAIADPIFQYLSSECYNPNINMHTISDNVTLGVFVLHSMFKFANSRNPSNLINSLNKSFTTHHTWVILLSASYHKMATVRKKLCKTFLCYLGYLNNHQLTFDVCVGIGTFACPSENNTLVAFSPSNCAINMIQQYIQICELLEENQTHLVLPAIKRIEDLILKINITEEFSSMWSFSILLRMLTCENRVIQKQGLNLCFNTSISTVLINQQSFNMFACHGLINSLCDDGIYFEERNADNSNSIFSGLCLFVQFCHDNHSDSVAFMKSILSAMAAQTWSSVSLFYVCEALSRLPPTKSWDSSDYLCLRGFLMQGSQRHNSIIKSHIQHSLLTCFINHTLLSSFRLSDAMSLLLMCVQSLPFTFNLSFWTKIVDWCRNEILMLKQNFCRTNSIVDLMEMWVKKCLTSEDKEFSSNAMDQLALAFCLTLDGLAATKNLKSLSTAVLEPLIATINKATLYVYMPQTSIDLSFAFIKSFASFIRCSPLQGKRNFEHLVDLCLKCFEGIIDYLSHQPISSKWVNEKVELYLKATEELICLIDTEASCAQKSRLLHVLNTAVTNVIRSFSQIDNHSIDDSGNMILYYCWCLKLLHEFNIPVDKSVWVICRSNFTLLETFCHQAVESHPISRSNALTKWLCFSYMSKEITFTLKETLKLFCDQLEVIPNENLPKMFSVGASLFTQITDDCHDVCGSCITAMLKLTFDLGHSSLFRSLYENFVVATFQPAILASQDGSTLSKTLKNVFREIMLHSQHKLGLLDYVIERCGLYWVPADISKLNGADTIVQAEKLHFTEVILGEGCNIHSPNIKSALDYVDFFICCLLYSPPFNKGVKSLSQAIMQSSCLADVSNANFMFIVSLKAISIILKLKLANTEHVAFANHLVEKLLQMDIAITHKKQRYHFLSPTHYEKQKLWQSLLILIPTIPMNRCEYVVNSFVSALSEIAESSVRHLIEWGLVLILFRFPKYETIIFEKLNSTHSKPHQAICSFLTVALLCGLARKSQNQIDYFKKVINSVLPWCMSQQFSIRLFAHAVLLRIYDCLNAAGEHELYPWIGPCITFADNASGNVKKNWIRIREHFMLFKFDPILEFSLETVLVSMPRLCKLDWPKLSEMIPFLPDAYLPKLSSCKTLRELQCSSWSSVGKPDNANLPHESSADEHTSNLQRKVVVGKQKQQDLVIVASLLDKFSNLGGLARTCEIFGVKSLVLHNLACVNDPGFQALSVTAHKWLRLEEIKSHELADYLNSLKTKGYAIVGGEQTEKSISLHNFKFPTKTAILLGNEKEGIPPSLLPSLDMCVEIPQIGVIRSLNVHVSGAIMVWEYSKQHMFSMS